MWSTVIWATKAPTSTNSSNPAPMMEKRGITTATPDFLIGTDMLRVLMGLPGLDLKEQKGRAKRAADEVMARIAASP
jgi:hypothetical protein